jgi:hypothetical protein
MDITRGDVSDVGNVPEATELLSCSGKILGNKTAAFSLFNFYFLSVRHIRITRSLSG